MTKNAQRRQAILDEASITLAHRGAADFPSALRRPAALIAERNSPASDQVLTI